MFLIGIAAFGLSSVACGLAPNPTVLVIARVAQGISAALMFPQALTGIQLNFDGATRVRAIGSYAIALSAGAVVGQILGGVLVSANIAGTQWRAIFLLNVPTAAITVAAGLRHLPADERRASRRIDLAGVATLTVSALLVVQGLGHSALISGLTLVPWVAAFGVAGQLVRRMPARLIALAPAVGCIILTSAYTAISITLFAGHHEEPLLIVLLAGGGLGLGLNFSAVIAHLTTAVPPGYAPDISGVASTTAAIGGTLGVAAFGTLYLGLLHAGSVHATHAFAIVTATFAAAALLATVAARRATLPSATPQAEPVSDSGIRAWP